MTLEAWIAKYEDKAQEAYDLHAPFKLLFYPQRGFAQIHVGETALLVWQMCGAAQWWFAELQRYAKENHRACVAAFVRRPILPYLRTFGFRVVRTENIDGNQRYHAIDKVGRKAVATYCRQDGEVEIYIVRCEVK